MTKLLAATGYIGGGSTVEVVNLDSSNPNLVCDNLPDFPFVLHGAVGHLFRGTTLIICGGASNIQFENRCHSLENGAWKSMPSTNETRHGTSSAVLSQTGSEMDDILIIAGGYPPTSSVESFDGKIWNETKFSKMPTTFNMGCMVKINNSMLMSIGGAKFSDPNDPVGETNFFNVIENKWFAGPQLNIPRLWNSGME